MNIWDNWNKWAFVSPPSRPSRAQIRAADAIIKGVKKDKPVCVLGSTIEYRSLLARSGFTEVYVIDQSEYFKEWSNQFLPAEVVGREKYIHSDWVSALSEFKGVFSAIFSDLTIGNAPFDHQVPLLEEIAKALGPDGIFLDKLLHLSGHLHSIGGIDDRFKCCPISIDSANDFNCRAVFTSSLLEEFGCVDTSRIYSELRRQISNINTRSILELTVTSITPEGCIWYYGPETKKMWSEYRQIYSIQRTIPEPRTSPYFSNCDFLCSMRRTNGIT